MNKMSKFCKGSISNCLAKLYGSLRQKEKSVILIPFLFKILIFCSNIYPVQIKGISLLTVWQMVFGFPL